MASLLPLFLLYSFCSSLSLHPQSISLPGCERTIKCLDGFICSFLDHVWDNSGCDCPPLSQCAEVNMDLWKQKHILGRTGNVFGSIYALEYWWEKLCLNIPLSMLTKPPIKTVIFVMIWKHFGKNPPWTSSNLLVNCTAGGTFSQVALILFFWNVLYFFLFQDMQHTWKFSSVFITDWNIWGRSLYTLSIVWALVLWALLKKLNS